MSTPLTVGHYCYEMLLNLANDFTYNPSQNIQNFVVAWSHKEGGGVTNQAKYNLLNTKQTEPGSTDAGHGIQAYPDAATGIKAQVDALSNGLYPNLKHALSTNDEGNLGFTGPNHTMASDIATELFVWLSGSTTYTQDSQMYVLEIMQFAGIPGASLQGGTMSGPGAGTPQSTINSWAAISLGGSASDVGPPGPNAGGTATPGSSTSAWNQNDILKVAAGILLILIGVVLFIKVQAPGSGIAKAIPFKI